MKNKHLKIISIILTIINSPFFLSTPIFADSNVCNMKDSVPPEVYEAAGCEQDNTQLPNTITNILYAIIGISGIIAVVYIIIGGINYMTSAGDTNKTEKAKKTILYACIGLVVCALAFAIVNWVITGVLKQ